MVETEEIAMSGDEDDGDSAVWDVLTEEQKKKFKKITEKNEENMKYIG